MDVGNYAPAARTTQILAPAARTTLNLAVLVVFLREIDLGPAIPRVHTLWARAGAFRHPAVVCNTTTSVVSHGLRFTLLLLRRHGLYTNAMMLEK